MSVNIEIHVGYNCCVKCADYFAEFVEAMKEEGVKVTAKGRFSTFYQGGNLAGNMRNPTVVPQSLIDRRGALFDTFFGESMIGPAGSGAIMSPADPNRYWGGEIGSQEAKEEPWYSIKRKREQGLLALAILRDTGILVDVLDEGSLSDDQLSAEQRIALEDRTGNLKKIVEEVNDKLKQSESKGK